MDETTSNTVGPLTSAVFHILLVLADGDAHGYAIMHEVERLTGGRVRLGPGTLYRSMYKMVLDGLIEELTQGQGPEDERRLTYRITARGMATARAEAQRLQALVRLARRRGLLREHAELRPRSGSSRS
jgi:DNA-binding PadR family transcriptional regulator